MKFEELYEKYKWGQVTEEEKEFVEKELGKYNDIKQCLDGSKNENKGEEEKEETGKRPEESKKRDIHLLKQMGLVTAAGMIILVAVFAVIYVVKIHPAIVQADKYKAEKAVVQEFPYQDWDITTRTTDSNYLDAQLGYERFYRLHMRGLPVPEFQYCGTLDQEKGQYYYMITDEDGRETMGITMNGVMTVAAPNPEYYFGVERTGDTLNRDIEKLEERKGYRVHITFEEYLEEEGIENLLEKDKENNYIRWVGISTSLDNSGYPLIGLYTLDYYEQISADKLKSYLNHQLEFMIDHPEVLNFLGKPELTEYYEIVKKDLENECKSFGVTIEGEKKEIEILCKDLKGSITEAEVVYSY